MPVDYGTDVSTYRDGDLDPTFTLISGNRAVAEAIARRLETPHGGLLRYPDYGADLRGWLSRDFNDPIATLFGIKTQVEEQAEQDERVISAEATVTYDPTAQRLHIVASIELASGPFELVLSVTAVTVELLAPS